MFRDNLTIVTDIQDFLPLNKQFYQYLGQQNRDVWADQRHRIANQQGKSTADADKPGNGGLENRMLITLVQHADGHESVTWRRELPWSHPTRKPGGSWCDLHRLLIVATSLIQQL